MRLEGSAIRTLPLHIQEQMGLAILEKMAKPKQVADREERKDDCDVKCDTRAFARCPYNKTCIAVEQTNFDEGSDCYIFNNRILESKITNADHVRGMNDVELATFLHTVTRACADHDCAACPIGPQNCIVMLNWARKPMEVV